MELQIEVRYYFDCSPDDSSNAYDDGDGDDGLTIIL